MSKKVKLTATDLGDDIGLIDIYHTVITGSTLLTGSVPGSQLLTTGYDFIVDDSVTVFIAQASNGACINTTGSITVTGEDQTVRYFRVYSDGNGTVEQTAPDVKGPTIVSFSASVDYAVHSLFTIEATPTYPFSFDGWFNDSSGTLLLSTNNPLSIGESDFSSYTDFYALFS
jgi:hypothetical protein